MKAGWKTFQLGEILDVQNGYAFDSKFFGAGGMPLIRIRDIKHGTTTETCYSGDYDDSYVVHSGDYLIGMDGEFRCYMWHGPAALLNQRVCRLTNFSPNVLPAFVCYGINKYLKEIEDVTGYSTVKHLSSKSILSIQFPLPPLAEQKRIVALLDEAFAGINEAKAKAEEKILGTKVLFERHIQYLFTKGAPEWKKKTVKDVTAHHKGAIRTGPFGSQLLHGEFVDKGIAVLGIDNAVSNEFRWGKSRFITPEKYRQLSRYTVHPGDVIITIMGTCGRCAVVPEDIGTAINTKHLCCITLDRAQCLPNYLHTYFLYAPQAQDFLSKNAKGSIMAGLNMGLIQEMPVLLPPLETQREFVEAAQILRTQTCRLGSIYSEKSTRLVELKFSLLTKAFAGELTA